MKIFHLPHQLLPSIQCQIHLIFVTLFHKLISFLFLYTSFFCSKIQVKLDQQKLTYLIQNLYQIHQLDEIILFEV